MAALVEARGKVIEAGKVASTTELQLKQA